MPGIMTATALTRGMLESGTIRLVRALAVIITHTCNVQNRWCTTHAACPARPSLHLVLAVLATRWLPESPRLHPPALLCRTNLNFTGLTQNLVNSKALKGIFSQTAGSTCEFWVNLVSFLPYCRNCIGRPSPNFCF